MRTDPNLKLLHLNLHLLARQFDEQASTGDYAADAAERMAMLIDHTARAEAAVAIGEALRLAAGVDSTHE